MPRRRSTYWKNFFPLAVGSLCLLFLFVFGLMPQRFLLDLDFAESGFAYPVVYPPLPLPTPPPPLEIVRPIPRGPAERFWDEYLQLFHAGDEEAALRVIEEYLRRYPGDLDVTLEYGRALWRLGRLEEAIAAYRSAFARGADPSARRELARVLAAARHWDEAADLYAQLVSLSPGDRELLREFARALVWAQRYEKAVAIYEELMRATPDDVELMEEFAAVAVWAERYDLAAQLYARLSDLDPDNNEHRLNWARALLWAGQPALSAEVVDGLPSGFVGSGVDSLRAAIALSLPSPLPPPDSVTANLPELASQLVLDGATDSALVLYRRYLSENPDADWLLLEMADVFEYRADVPDSAVAYLREYLARQPYAHDVRLRLARLLAWSGRFADAESAALTIVQAQPEDAEAWVLLGDLYRWQGERDRAAEAYERALKADPSVPGAAEGLADLEAQVDLLLTSQGTIGPTSGLEHFTDSDDFRLTRLRAGWTGGTPRTRWGGAVTVEESRGYGATGGLEDLFAVELGATLEHWWMRGDLNVLAWAGAWIPDAGGSVEPILGLRLAAPNWGGAAYRFEYTHGPAYRETATLEAAVSGLRSDVAGLEFYRPMAERWDLTIQLRAAVFSGVGDANLRSDAGVGIYFKPDDHWVLGYETRGLAFSDSAPNPGRRLYWDPEWSWSNFAVIRWRGEPAQGWELDVSLVPGFAWLSERDREPTLVAELGAWLDARRHLGAWTLAGRAGLTQSRADGYRSFRLEFDASRRFGR
jgi:predicted Zn-dependent protease